VSACATSTSACGSSTAPPASCTCTAWRGLARRSASRCPIWRPPSASRRNMEIKVLVVDDEQLARDELCYLLEQAGGVTVVAQAANGVDALALIAEHAPDLVFLDVQMPGLNGFEVAG